MNRHQRRASAKRGRTAKSPYAESAASRTMSASAELSKVAIDHHQAGRLAEAETCYRQIMATRPDHVVTQYNLGVVLHDQGKVDEAIAAYREAIRISPLFERAHANLGHALRKQGRLQESIAAYHQAIRIKPNHAEVHFNLGLALSDQSRFQEAIAAYQNAIRIKGNYAEAHCNIGLVLLKLGVLDEAVVAVRKAIASKPDLAEAHNLLGVALMQLGQLSEAKESFEQAVRHAPTDAAYRLAASEVTRFVPGDPRLAELEQFARDNASRPDTKQIELHFALGKAYDDVGQHADAFRHWLEGNALKRQQIAYDEATTLEELNQVRSVYTPEFIQASQNAGHPSSVPVFIIGMPRSGTTLIEQILASHPEVFGAGELMYFRHVVEGTLAMPGGSATAGKDMRSLGARYLAAVERLAPSARRITDKLPRNFIFVGLIHRALPNATIIHVTRDPVDTCLSCFSKFFTEEQDFTYDLAELGRYYRGYQNLMEHWYRVLPSGRILDVRYEDVVADLEGQARRIIAHCGLDWDPRCLAFHKTERPVRTASAMQVRQPIYNSAIGHWHVYAEFLGPLLEELGLARASRRDLEAAKNFP
jgi:tetratricopeptide (TPR) repeat protein